MSNGIENKPLSKQVKIKSEVERNIKEKSKKEIQKLKDALASKVKRAGIKLPKLEKETNKKIYESKQKLKRNLLNISRTEKKDLKLLQEYGPDAQRAKGFMRKTSETGQKPKIIRTVTTDKKGNVTSKSKPITGRLGIGTVKESPYDRPSKPTNPKKSNRYSKEEVKKITGKKGNKNITKSQQKTIDQAAPVIDRIVKGDKRKVKLAPKPEELKVNKKMSGGLVGGQAELDLNNNKRIDGGDFKLLAKKKYILVFSRVQESL